MNSDTNIWRIKEWTIDAERILRIETETDTLKLIGPELLEGENKYQNGFAGKDGCM